MRPKGKWVYKSKPNPLVQEAEKHQAELDEVRRKKAEARANRPLLNKHTYAWLYEEWMAEDAAGRRHPIPKCKRCYAILHWEEPAHECPGFVPKYVDWDEEEREAIHEYMRTADGYADWDDDQYDPSVPGSDFSKLRHEASTGETYDQVVIEGMTEENWLERKFGRRT